MSTSVLSKQIFAILLFSAGIILATALTTAMTWASLEADFYGFQRYASDERLSGLSCPPLMTPSEKASVKLKTSNPTKKEITPIVRIDTSTANVPESMQEQLTLQPGETQQITQTISADNIDLGFFIFAKAFRYPAYPLPSAEATCGIIVLPEVPLLNGSGVFYVWLGLSLLLIALGLWWRWKLSLKLEIQNRSNENAAQALGLVAMLGLLVSLQGLWLIGLLLVALTLLLAVAILRMLSVS